MSERATRIGNDNSGDFIATRTSYDTDQNSNDRVVQRFDLASERGPSPLGTANRGSSGTLNDIDVLDLTTLSSDLTNNLIDIGDKSMLVVSVELSASTTNSVIITPIMFDNENTPGVMGILESKAFNLAYDFKKASTSGYIPATKIWDTSGAHKIGLHITEWADAGGSITIKVYGWVI